MKFNISHLVETKDLLNILSRYPLGLEIIQFSIASVLDEVDESLVRYKEELGSYLEERELVVHGPFFDLSPASFDSGIRRVTMQRFEAAYEVAQKLGAKKIVYHTGFIPITYYIEGWLGNSILFWKEFMVGKEEDIQVCIENVYEEEFWPIVQLIDEVNHPNFKACLDIGHVNAYSNIPIEYWIQGISHRITHVHVHNNHGTKDEHRGVTEGNMNILQVLKEIEQVTSQASATLEISNLEELKASIEWLKVHFNH